MKKSINNLSFRKSVTLSLSKCAARYGICFIISAMLFTACDKNDDDSPQDPVSQLPPATTTGENTFGYLVNGKVVNVRNTSGLSAVFQNGLLQISANISSGSNDETIALRAIDPIIINQDYTFNNTSYRAGYTKSDDGSICIYTFENTYVGTVFFNKIDRVNYIISGKFEFSTVTNGCENIEITEGRFDLQYIP